jgi:hypothetical protein
MGCHYEVRTGVCADTSTGKSEPSPERDEIFTDTLKKIDGRFHWLNDEAHDRLDALQAELKDSDPPDWSAELVLGIMSLALGGGAAGAAEFLASKVVSKSNPLGNAFFKNIFAQGIKDGAATGSKLMTSGKSLNIDAFVAAQKLGVTKLHQKNFEAFVDTTAHGITTLEQALAFAETMSDANLDVAADKQHDASRDAYVSALAQAKFGQLPSHDHSVVTNMHAQSERDAANRRAPGNEPDDAPSLIDAMHRRTPGVLEVWVELPDRDRSGMDRMPHVKFALLNGVNHVVREQYNHRPLSSCRIPRQVKAHVPHSGSSFVLNVDEQGEIAAIDHPEWLQARAFADSRQSATMTEAEQADAGAALLLGSIWLTGIA